MARTVLAREKGLRRVGAARDARGDAHVGARVAHHAGRAGRMARMMDVMWAHMVRMACASARRFDAVPTGKARAFVAASLAALVIALLAVPLSVRAQDQAQTQAHGQAQQAQQAQKQPVTQPRPPSTPLQPSPAFAKFPAYTGTLGKRAIVLRLGPESDAGDPSGVQGEYQFSDTGQVILVAGDRTGATLEIEESDDGTNITGNWVGTFAADGSLSGERMNPDDSSAQPFALRPVKAKRAGAAAELARTATSAASAKKSARGRGAGAMATAGAKSSATDNAGSASPTTPSRPPSGSSGVHPVKGASNLTTDD